MSEREGKDGNKGRCIEKERMETRDDA